MNDLLDKAISKGSTVWLKEWLTAELPNLPSDATAIDVWFDSLIDTFEARNLIEPKQQKNFLTQVRNAIKVTDEAHPALDIVKFDKETWIGINNEATDRIAQRSTKFISNPEIIVNTAKELISSFDWAAIAAGLAVLTGRRSSEVIKTAKFEYKTEYSVIFSGSLKRKSEPVNVVFEIPTLCKAKLVIDAVAHLREFLGPEIEELSVKQTSGRYSRAVSKKCDEYFADLVPRRKGEDNLYSHLFRAVYATIASYWYCPPTVPEMEYRAAIQGHYQILEEQDPVLRRSLAAGRHYFDYKISDGMANIDGRLGIKLDKPGVKVIEEFARSHIPKDSQSNDSDKKQVLEKNILNGSRNKHSKVSNKAIMNDTVTIPRYLISRLNLLAEKLEMNEKDALEALFDWAEVSLSLADVLEIDELKPNVLYDRVEAIKVQTEQASNLVSQNIIEDYHEENLSFDTQSVSDLCSSVKILTQIIAEREYLDERVERKLKSNSSDSSKTKKVKQSSSDNTGGRKSSSRTAEAELVINHAIDRIIEYNEQEDMTHKDKFMIGIGAVRKMTGRGDGVIRRVLKERQSELEQHHEKHKLGIHHNSKGKEAKSVEELVPLDEDYLKEQIAAI